MELIIGSHAGFCYGVRRAIEQASACAEAHMPCATLGPLIHNPQEVERLQQAGIRCVAVPEEAKPGETLLIRSHGVTPDLLARAQAMGPVIDLTCPHVAHIQQLVRAAGAQGEMVLLVGEATHPEVVGIAGWATGPVLILQTPEEARAATLPQAATVVAQTTLRRDRFEAVLAVLQQRVPQLRVHRTICSATGLRQEEAERLSAEADAVIVVGGRNSSNTNKLYETCCRHCKRTLLAETPEDIPEGFVCREDRVAVTAGASTPQWLLAAVCQRLTAMGEQSSF